MRLKIAGYLMTLAAGVTLLFACEGPREASVANAVAPLQNPVLVNYSTTVAANFSNYTSYVKFGGRVTFKVAPMPDTRGHLNYNTATFSSFSTVTTRVVQTDRAGMAWVRVKSPQPGKFLVTASSDEIGGNTILTGATTVSFINQPAAVSVRLGLRSALANVGELNFDLISTDPAPSFVNFSGSASPLIFAQDPTPIIPGTGVRTTNLNLNSRQGIGMAALRPLFRFDYVPVPPSVPVFTVANVVSSAADVNNTQLFPALFILSTTYYDAAGNVIFY